MDICKNLLGEVALGGKEPQRRRTAKAYAQAVISMINIAREVEENSSPCVLSASVRPSNMISFGAFFSFRAFAEPLLPGGNGAAECTGTPAAACASSSSSCS